MKGKVKFFSGSKGYGFITGDDGKDYFVHISAIPEGLRLYEGDDVSFDVAETERGMQAQNVQKVEGGSEAPAEESTEEATEEATEEPAEEAEAESEEAEAPAEEAESEASEEAAE